MATEAFRASSMAWRLYSGDEAIEQHLASEVARAHAQRAFVICSPSITRRTTVAARIAEALGSRYAGVFDGIEKDSTYTSVSAAKAAAVEAGADLLIAVGGGSVIVATRAVAIFMAESASPFEVMTQYPEGKPAFSPRLLAPKPPIINVPTTPTSAMNRAGTGLKNDDLDHRMEYFDPKTRPHAIVWDTGALMSAPPDLIRSTATTVFASTVAGMAETDVNPLVDADRQHAFRLAHGAYPRVVEAVDDPAPRFDLCAAALLQNRAEDDGRRGRAPAPFADHYAVSTALHVRYPHVGQGESTSVVAATAMRLHPAPPEASARSVALALGLSRGGMGARDATLAIADAVEALYQRAGVPTRLRQLEIPRADIPLIARETVKNFNANAGARSEADQVEDAIRLLEAAW